MYADENEKITIKEFEKRLGFKFPWTDTDEVKGLKDENFWYRLYGKAMWFKEFKTAKDFQRNCAYNFMEERED